MKKILAFVAVSVLLATQAFAAYLPFTNEDGDTYVNNVYTTTVNGVQISDNVAIYVTKTGNDTTGDGTLANPYLTIGKGLEELVNWVSPNTMLLHIGAGTYTENVNVPRELAGVVDIQGDSSNPDNVVISAANPNLPALTISGTAKFYLRGIKVQGATNTYGVFVDRGDLTIYYCKFYNNQYGVSAYNNSKINFVYTSTGASSIDGNNIGSSYGILADFNSVMNIGQAITISNVAIGVYNRTSTTYLSAAATITASMTVWRSEKDSYNNIQGVQTLTGTSTASGRNIFYLAQSEMDFSGATLNMSTSYYGFYGFTGVKIIDSGTTYSYTNITVPAYFDYDTVLDVTGTPLGTTTSYYKAAAEYGYDALFPYADSTNLNQACSTTSSPTFVRETILDSNNSTFLNGEGGSTTGDFNVAIGRYSLENLTTGVDNVAVGFYALSDITEQSLSTAIGSNALKLSTAVGGSNVAVGRNALKNNITGYQNTAIGSDAMSNGGLGSLNTAVGKTALVACEGNNNVALGYNAGADITTGNENTFLGYFSGDNALQKVDAVNSTAIGANTYTTKSNQVVLGDANVTETVLRGTVVLDALGITQEDVGATCSLGQIRLDTGGATKELCYCSATNTWLCTAMASGPAD